MTKKTIVSAVVLTLLLMSIPAAALTADTSSAAVPTGDGDKYKVSMVEGAVYSYTPEYSIGGVTTTLSGTAASWLHVSGNNITGTAPEVSKSGGNQTYDLTIKATTQHPYQEAYQHITFTIYDKMTASVNKSIVNTYVNGTVSLSASSNFTGVSYSIAGAPNGVTINKDTGAISGKISDTAKKYTATVSVKHLASGQTKNCNVTFNVSGTLAVNSDADMYAVNGKVLPTSDGDPNYYKFTANLSGVTFKLTGGSQMPSGMTLNANGTITGTPTAMGDHTVHVTATETATGQTAAFDLNIHIVSKLSFSSTPTGGIIVSGA